MPANDWNDLSGWLDFSGAVPLVIPRSLVALWRGGTDPATGLYRAHDGHAPPVTDYDRACAAAWPGRGLVPLGGGQALALYSEFDLHAWSERLQVLACGGWWPNDEELQGAAWADPISWHTADEEVLMLNSAADASEELRADEFLTFRLVPGEYVVTTASLEGESYGYYHRFRRVAAA